MVRMILVLAVHLLAARAIAQSNNPYSLVSEAGGDSSTQMDSSTQSNLGSPQVRIYTPPKNMGAGDYAWKLFSPEFRIAPTPARSQSGYLQSAGYHWLTSIGLAIGASAVGYITKLDGPAPQVLFWGLAAGSLGFLIAVPIDLILAGSTSK